MPIRDNFWENTKLNEKTGCLEWQRGKANYGYGSLRDENGKSVKAHRYAWVLVNGPIPEGMEVLHSCDNTPCCNPKHLFLGTQKENMEDMTRKGRRKSKIPPQKGEGNNNSVLTKENVIEIKRLLKSGFFTHQKISDTFHVSRPTISLINTGKTWKEF